MPTPKEKLIAQVDDFNEQHNLTISTEGTEAEIRARLQAAQAQLAQGTDLGTDLGTEISDDEKEPITPAKPIVNTAQAMGIYARYTVQVRNQDGEVITVAPDNLVETDSKTAQELLDNGLAYTKGGE